MIASDSGRSGLSSRKCLCGTPITTPEKVALEGSQNRA